jgi:enamine deaminase RidA (YjgF/YER057c/UK114 family)
MARPDQVFHIREHEKRLGFAFAVDAGRTLYVSGTCALDAQGEAAAPGDLAGQMRIIYADIAKALAAHGLDFRDVVKEQVFVTDIGAFRQALPVRAEVYKDAAPPAATWIEVPRLMRPAFMIEIEVTAIRR